MDIKQKARVKPAHTCYMNNALAGFKPGASTLCPRRHFSSWNRAHMTEHNIHSNNYPQRDDVTCLFNFVWTGVRLILSLIVPQPCPFKESLLSFGSKGLRRNPITVIDWWLRSNTWATHTGSGHIRILRQKGRQEDSTNMSLATTIDTTSWDSSGKIFYTSPPKHRCTFFGFRLWLMLSSGFYTFTQ